MFDGLIPLIVRLGPKCPVRKGESMRAGQATKWRPVMLTVVVVGLSTGPLASSARASPMPAVAATNPATLPAPERAPSLGYPS